jgi:exopolyphosphatase/guanosine-5'-triphosphate,3'-diphosphate pyrophosphatase
MFKTKVGVADLGTNTFQFLIAESGPDGWHELFNIQEMVKLGEGGINKGLIQPAAFERGTAAMQKFAGLLAEYGVNKVRAIATSALRNAANGQQFIEEVRNQTGIEIEVIDGDQEAAFIYRGIKASGCLSDKYSLIIDIGGGSVEFIIGNSRGIKWKQSFEIGCARLTDKFHRVDPIPAESIAALNLYLDHSLNDLLKAVPQYTIENIIGSSGSFETFAGLIELEKGNAFDLEKTKVYDFDRDELDKILRKLIASSHLERLNNKWIIPVRVDMIVSASLVTRSVMERLEISNVKMSTSSLKEGVLAEMRGF